MMNSYGVLGNQNTSVPNLFGNYMHECGQGGKG